LGGSFTSGCLSFITEIIFTNSKLVNFSLIINQ
jgi:hypothetical protein